MTTTQVKCADAAAANFEGEMAAIPAIKIVAVVRERCEGLHRDMVERKVNAEQAMLAPC